MISLKELKEKTPLLHFKMEFLQSLKAVLLKNEYMGKLNLKDAHLYVSISQDDKKSDVFVGIISVAVSNSVLWSCTNPICFHKFPENPHGVCKKERDFDITSLDERLVFGRSKIEIPALRDTVFFLLQCLCFVTNQKKWLRILAEELEILSMIIDSKQMTLSLRKKNLQLI